MQLVVNWFRIFIDPLLRFFWCVLSHKTARTFFFPPFCSFVFLSSQHFTCHPAFKVRGQFVICEKLFSFLGDLFCSADLTRYLYWFWKSISEKVRLTSSTSQRCYLQDYNPMKFHWWIYFHMNNFSSAIVQGSKIKPMPLNLEC